MDVAPGPVPDLLFMQLQAGHRSVLGVALLLAHWVWWFSWVLVFWRMWSLWRDDRRERADRWSQRGGSGRGLDQDRRH